MTERILLLASALLAATACTQEYELDGDRPNVDPGDVTDCGFTAVSGTKMSRYDCNPVFSGTDEGWSVEIGSTGFYATDVLGHPFYQMWYTGFPSADPGFGDYAMGYAVSADGTNWDVHPANPLIEQSPDTWDSDMMAGQVVVWDEDFDQYVMAYQGFTVSRNDWDPGIWGMGIATSPDGRSWSKHPGNPVINFGDLTDVSPCWPLTITKTGGGFRGYLAGTDYYEALWGEDTCHIYSATALDLGVWTVGTTPVLRGDAWYDKKGIAGAAVVEYDDVLYMFYVGFEEWIPFESYQTANKMHLALATSLDGGLTWYKDPNNPIAVDLSTPGKISDVGAQVIGSRIHLWVTDEYEGRSGVGYFYYEPDITDHD